MTDNIQKRVSAVFISSRPADDAEGVRRITDTLAEVAGQDKVKAVQGPVRVGGYTAWRPKLWKLLFDGPSDDHVTDDWSEQLHACRFFCVTGFSELVTEIECTVSPPKHEREPDLLLGRRGAGKTSFLSTIRRLVTGGDNDSVRKAKASYRVTRSTAELLHQHFVELTSTEPRALHKLSTPHRAIEYTNVLTTRLRSTDLFEMTGLLTRLTTAYRWIAIPKAPARARAAEASTFLKAMDAITAIERVAVLQDQTEKISSLCQHVMIIPCVYAVDDFGWTDDLLHASSEDATRIRKSYLDLGMRTAPTPRPAEHPRENHTLLAHADLSSPRIAFADQSAPPIAIEFDPDAGVSEKLETPSDPPLRHWVPPRQFSPPPCDGLGRHVSKLAASLVNPPKRRIVH
ncbi:MAG: hypothetical protein AAFR03_00445 [Pseudomonadota bacterium]